MAKEQLYMEQSIDQLEVDHRDLSQKLFELRSERRTTGKVEKPHLIKETKRNIARILTAKRSKQRGG